MESVTNNPYADFIAIAVFSPQHSTITTSVLSAQLNEKIYKPTLNNLFTRRQIWYFVLELKRHTRTNKMVGMLSKI